MTSPQPLQLVVEAEVNYLREQSTLLSHLHLDSLEDAVQDQRHNSRDCWTEHRSISLIPSRNHTAGVQEGLGVAVADRHAQCQEQVFSQQLEDMSQGEKC